MVLSDLLEFLSKHPIQMKLELQFAVTNLSEARET